MERCFVTRQSSNITTTQENSQSFGQFQRNWSCKLVLVIGSNTNAVLEIQNVMNCISYLLQCRSESNEMRCKTSHHRDMSWELDTGQEAKSTSQLASESRQITTALSLKLYPDAIRSFPRIKQTYLGVGALRQVCTGDGWASDIVRLVGPWHQIFTHQTRHTLPSPGWQNERFFTGNLKDFLS